jgi:hypothetical protein
MIAQESSWGAIATNQDTLLIGHDHSKPDFDSRRSLQERLHQLPQIGVLIELNGLVEMRFDEDAILHQGSMTKRKLSAKLAWMAKFYWVCTFCCVYLLWPPPQLSAQAMRDTSLYHRRYDQVAMLCTHNAYNVRGQHRLPNQNLTVAQQLDLGVRGFMLDVYAHRDRILLYHANRILGSRLLQEDLAMIKTFLEEHPQEVLSIIFESHISAEQLERSLSQAGLLPYLYQSHAMGEAWPTLGQMIAMQQRLVIFSEKDRGNPYPWLLHAWDYMTENRYSNHRRADFETRYNRGDSTNRLYLLNHFITHRKFGYGLQDSAKVANTASNVLDHALDAWARTRHFPNFVAVDFVDQGNAGDAVVNLNAIWRPAEPLGKCLMDTAFFGEVHGTVVVRFHEPIQEPFSLRVRDIHRRSIVMEMEYAGCPSAEAILLLPASTTEGIFKVELWMGTHYERRPIAVQDHLGKQ